MACDITAGAGGVVVTPHWGRGSPSSSSSLGRRVGQVPLLEWRVPGWSKCGGSWAGSHGIFHHGVNNPDFCGGHWLLWHGRRETRGKRGAQEGGRSLGQPWVPEVEPQHSVQGPVLLVFVLASGEMVLVVLQVTGPTPGDRTHPTWPGWLSAWSHPHSKAQGCLLGWDCLAERRVPPSIPPGSAEATAGIVLVPC